MGVFFVEAGLLAGHLEDEQADGQARERGEGAGGGGEPVGEDDGVAEPSR
jgi:hypothetical protein